MCARTRRSTPGICSSASSKLRGQVMELFRSRFDSPLGQVTVLTDAHALRAVDFDTVDDTLLSTMTKLFGDVTVTEAKSPIAPVRRLQDYFEGDLKAINRLPVTIGGTPFQNQVWNALLTIPLGQTVSYADVARHIGRPTAFRAVGLAVGANPIGIVVPCHRVIGSNAKMVGYAAGLDRKVWLLQHEKAIIAEGYAVSRSKRTASTAK